MEENPPNAEIDAKKRVHDNYLVSRLNKKSAEDPYNVEVWYGLLQAHTFETEVRETNSTHSIVAPAT